MPSVRRVRDWYAESFHELIEFPNFVYPKDIIHRERVRVSVTQGLTSHLVHRYFNNVDDANLPPTASLYNQEFVDLIEKIKRRHDPVVTTLSQGIQELKEMHGLKFIDPQVQSFLDRFYLSRIGIRMLIGQHIGINKMPHREKYVGIICTETRVSEIAEDAIENARFICEDHYALFQAPQVQLHCPPDLHFMYVPSHLHHMLFELLKNSLRAVVESRPHSDKFPVIKVVVSEGKEDIAIKVSDEGGGIPRSGIPLIWTYLYTTAQPPPLNPKYNQSDFKAPMAGYGYGLPLSRLYARYFGGDLRLISMEGYGTDVYLYLRRLSDSEEALP
ncbi:hypothetical protein HMI54_006202 [Coelomomyces lativittatus]|nr:hypothetical protein HMI54_006202 [Coelomomyces lativittatus]